MALNAAPSQRIGLQRNPWLAYQFDNAVLVFGRFVEGELDRVKGNSAKITRIKRRMKLHTLLGLPAYVPKLDPKTWQVIE